LKYTWRSLNEAFPAMSEAQVKLLLDEELATLRRPRWVERLHQRYNTLRVARERAELLASLL
jgi:arsenate reductase-like glutaredoxin family protein